MVGHNTLDVIIGVRLPAPQHLYLEHDNNLHFCRELGRSNL